MVCWYWNNRAMKAKDTPLLTLLRAGTQRVVPIYQRIYSWGEDECARLWDDIVHAGENEQLKNHFTGSIVYVERDEGTRTSQEPDLIIDGQQRVTTVMLLLAALAKHLEDLPEDQREPVDGFAPRKIRNRYLTNPDEDGDRFYKLILSKSDKPALQALLSDRPAPEGSTSRVQDNFDFFKRKLATPGVDLVTVCLGLDKLGVVDVHLTRGEDDPQLVFETMNSTGKKLSQADLIRNFVLMDLPPKAQTELYEGYWYPMEQRFTGPAESKFDEFVRHYLTMKTGDIPRLDDIYDAFKNYSHEQDRMGMSRRQLVEDLHQYSIWYAAIALGKEQRPRLARAFYDIEQLRATVVYPFLLRLYRDFAQDVIDEDQFVEILGMTASYLLRRGVAQIPTNTHNSTFATLGNAIDPKDYVTSIAARFLSMGGSARFPSDQEFTDALETTDFYRFKRAAYFFRKMENEGRKEEVSTAEYTIEHIMPQNPNLSQAWKKALGEDWEEVHERYLHTLGNLTLTGYNSEYSDRPFAKKRDMEGGFKDSPLRLNRGLGQLETWNSGEITKRAQRLAQDAAHVWRRPVVDEARLDYHRARFNDRSGFDWHLTHRILEQLPAGRWTSYSHLAEAVGTHAQPLANHIASCPICQKPYRVLTIEGRLSPGFRWTDPDDQRDPRQVLEDEGVRFINGIADPEQRMDAEELTGLVA